MAPLPDGAPAAAAAAAAAVTLALGASYACCAASTAAATRRPPPRRLGARRVLIVGAPGSGKSFLAARLAEALGLPATHIDRLWYRPGGWEFRGAREIAADFEAVAARDAWVFEGNMNGGHEATGVATAQRAEWVIYLDLPGVTCAGQAMWRCLTYPGGGRTDLPIGADESWDLGFYREILQWKSEHGSHCEEMLAAAEAAGATITRLTTPAELEAVASWAEINAEAAVRPPQKLAQVAPALEPEPLPEPEPEPLEEGPWLHGQFAELRDGVFRRRAANRRAQDCFDEEERTQIRIRNQKDFANRPSATKFCAAAIDALPAVWPVEPDWPQQPLAPHDEAVPLTLVDSADAFLSMVEILEAVDVISLDIEQCQQRSFYGLICTLQISSAASGNFLINALNPSVRSAIRGEFGRIVSNPGIIKVMHGCKDDAKWLQRDFSIFLVNVFDTFEAAEALGLPANFGGLLNCLRPDVPTLDKDLQTADWTRRPLPVTWAYYAVADAHYLLPVAAELWRKAESQDGQNGAATLHALCEKAKGRCRQLWPLRVPGPPASPWASAPGNNPDNNFKIKYKAWSDQIHRTPCHEQCVADLYIWRDSLCRQLDEGLNHVCSTHLLLDMAQRRPASVDAVMDMLGPVTIERLPDGAAAELVQVIAQSAVMPEPLEQIVGADNDYKTTHCVIFDSNLKISVAKSQKATQSEPKYMDVGGKRDPHETDPWITMVREAFEETGWDLNDISSFQVIGQLPFIVESKSVGYLIIARDPERVGVPKAEDTVQEIVSFTREEAMERCSYRGKQIVRKFYDLIEWKTEFDTEEFWTRPVDEQPVVLNTLATISLRPKQQAEPVVATLPSVYHRYSKRNATLLSAQPLLVRTGWICSGQVELDEEHLKGLADLAALLLQAAHGREAAHTGEKSLLMKLLRRSVMLLPEWPRANTANEAAAQLVKQSNLKRIGCPSESMIECCESVLAQSLYKTLSGQKEMYISQSVLEPGTAYTLQFEHSGGSRRSCYNCGEVGHLYRDCSHSRSCYSSGQVGHLSRDCGDGSGQSRRPVTTVSHGMINHGEYMRKQYECQVDSNDRVLECQRLPLVDGLPEQRETRLCASWTMFFPNISQACVVAIGHAYQQLGVGEKAFPLRVRNLPYSTTRKQLFAVFSGATNASVATGQDGKSRGSGHVVFSSEEDREAALGHEYVLASNRGDRILKLEKSQCTASAESSLCWSALSMGFSLGSSTTITLDDMRSVLDTEEAVTFGRWAKLGDAVVELAARQVVAAEPFGVVCTGRHSCSERHHLGGVIKHVSEQPGVCPFCTREPLVSNVFGLSPHYDAWIQPNIPSSYVVRDAHTKGDCVEACIGIVAQRFSLDAACTIFTQSCARLPVDLHGTVRSVGTTPVDLLDDVLRGKFGPAAELREGTSSSVDTMRSWTRCVFVGEAITNLCVLLFHFRTNPDADKDTLHRLQRTEPQASVKEQCLATAAQFAGVADWLMEDGGHFDGQENALGESWKAAIGLLYLSDGMDDDDSWDVGDGVIHRYLLKSVKISPEPKPDVCDEFEPEPEPELEPEPEPELDSEPEPELDSEPEPEPELQKEPPARQRSQLESFALLQKLVQLEHGSEPASLSEPEPGPELELELDPQPDLEPGLGDTLEPVQAEPDIAQMAERMKRCFEPERESKPKPEPAQRTHAPTQLAQIHCVCKNCDALLAHASSVRLEKNNTWPPMLKMSETPTLRQATHPDEEKRKRGFGKALCVQCEQDVGPTQGGNALLKVRNGPKVLFTRDSGAVIEAKDFLAMYIREHV